MRSREWITDPLAASWYIPVDAARIRPKCVSRWLFEMGRVVGRFGGEETRAGLCCGLVV